MKRLYESIIKEHFKSCRQMLFVMGPRQSGKTTTAQALKDSFPKIHYYNWDKEIHKDIIIAGSDAIAQEIKLEQIQEDNITPLIIFDEIHKYSDWKMFLKGFYDTFPNQAHILVTGSARLDVYKKGGDSLMGRYFSLRHHPISVAELCYITPYSQETRPKPQEISGSDFSKLLDFGGYPDPFLQADKRFYNKWSELRQQQLFKEDIRDLTRVYELDRFELLAKLLTSQVGQLTSYNQLAKKIKVNNKTIENWIKILESSYYCFSIRPWSKNITRSLLKEPKYYLWDWSLCKNVGEKAENFIASHLLKATQFWSDYGFGKYEIYFLRDKDKKEVDFLITRDETPWILIEVKQTQQPLSSSLLYFQKQVNAEHIFQVTIDMPYVNKDCFSIKKPVVVPALTLLSQLI